ncbi:MAG: DUF2791 family P-loop domain-containing protein [Myxococcota bacterium]|nr:DUF2791 family P-loop domain-containing protein [Myxococcota bacterium]
MDGVGLPFVALQLRALEELSHAEAASVGVVVDSARRSPSVEALLEAALAAGFATSRASMARHGLDALPSVVATLARSLRVRRGRRGVVEGYGGLLDAFGAEHGARAAERFEERATAVGAWGELRRLSARHVDETSPEGRAAALERWLRGRSTTDGSEMPPLRPLDESTSRTALSTLARLLRALGVPGWLVVLDDADGLVELTPARRDVAYGVLRELLDNTDGHGGLLATRVLLVGTPVLLQGRHALSEHPALATRLGLFAEPNAEPESESVPPGPHAPLLRLDRGPLRPTERLRRTKRPRPVELRQLIRLVQGLPPLEATSALTVGAAHVDAAIDKLFEHSAHDASVFNVLVGDFGAGKTHYLLHLEARALAQRRPVLRLAVERLDEDLGNPQRHLRRLLESSVTPGRGRPGLLARLHAWCSTQAELRRLQQALRSIAAERGELSSMAERWTEPAFDPTHLVRVLEATDLASRPAAPNYRRDAYQRLLLWLELLRRMDGCEGPVVVIDEAENLFRPGVSRPERRTALRALSFYCGGAIPRACVILAITPATLERLRAEAMELLNELETQVGLLREEDVAMLRQRLRTMRPIEVRRLGRDELVELAQKVRALHARVRGSRRIADFDAWVRRLAAGGPKPRQFVQRVVQRLERVTFYGEA